MAASGAETEPQWPPRSPHEALLSTPGGRERLRRLAERASPSPSPSKRGRMTPAALATASANRRRNNATREDEDDDGFDLEANEDEDEDEDEEMLQLKLAAIQAKLKLKKLQSAKAKKEATGTAERSNTLSSRPDSAPLSHKFADSRAQSRAEVPPSGTTLRPQSQADFQVPASPARRAQTAQDQTSPSRIRLGIDKGLKAKDVSLKRMPSIKRPYQESQPTSQGGYLRRALTPGLGTTADHRQPTATTQERPQSFSERLAAARTEEASRKERQERIRQVRSKAFHLGKQEIEHFKSTAAELPDIPLQPAQYDREDVVAGDQLKRSNTVPNLRRLTQDEDRSSSSLGAADVQGAPNTRRKKLAPSEVPEEEASAFEPYSGVHLSKRIIPHTVLARNFAGKKTHLIKDLLQHVKAPDWELPEIEQDIVVFGILASKSEPRAHKNTTNNAKEKYEPEPSRGKYMVLSLCDLQWELELFLFNTGFERYWKLTPGTLIAILNPTIMPPPPGRADTGRFSLVINSGEDTILEIGNARDLGFCKSVKKDGDLCNKWVNHKRTEFCEFHMNLALEKHKQARQDINAFNMGLGPGGNKKKANSYRAHNLDYHANNQHSKQRPDGGSGGAQYDRATHSSFFMAKASAASMLDNEMIGGGKVTERLERSEALRRRLATEEKERGLMKQLGKIGTGAGKDYMSLKSTANNNSNKFGSSLTSNGSSDPSASEESRQERPDARALGLVLERGRAQPKIHLSPVKRKRTDSALSNMSSSSSSTSRTTVSKTAGLGWGGGLKDKLARMKEGENLGATATSTTDGSIAGSATESNDTGRLGGQDKPPARKKTRFVTEKGIREAGRESLGDNLEKATDTGSGSGLPEGASNSGDNGVGNSENRPFRRRGRGMVVLDDVDDDDLLILD